ncbi:hypothetical protein ON010_g5100 [Phytophthora cinnamomi]|nr:hypothetical protein ON010_g5100 [Phytophthora cinnamomi]
MRLAHTARQRLWSAWASFQVEFQGHYSVERLQQLGRYANSVSTAWILLICLLTPLPCLAFGLLKEVPPLEPPEAGVKKNWVFFIRAVIVTTLINATLLVQIGQGAPRVKLTRMQVAFISLLASVVSLAFIYAVCSATVFPLPFGVLVTAPPDVLVMTICFIRIFGPRVQADPSLLSEINQQIAVVNCQVALTFIYPVYIYGFVSLTGVNQILFVLVLPIIKLIAKNWVSRALVDYDDLKPQSVIFVVEVFNALYVSNALQSASSWALTITIMVVDVVHFWLSMQDVLSVLKEVTVLMASIPSTHSLAKENFLQVAMRILAADSNLKDSTRLRSFCGTSIFRETSSAKITTANFNDSSPVPTGIADDSPGTNRGFETGKILPVQNSKTNVPPIQTLTARNIHAETDNTDIKSIFSVDERALFIKKSAQVLFITEYVILVEYVEVVLPIVYVAYRTVLFYMPNRAFYASMAELTIAQLFSSAVNVLAYSSLEFGSLIVSTIVLKRTLGISPWRQLGFVLETHTGMVQSMLINLLIYITQISLAHLGIPTLTVQTPHFIDEVEIQTATASVSVIVGSKATSPHSYSQLNVLPHDSFLNLISLPPYVRLRRNSANHSLSPRCGESVGEQEGRPVERILTPFFPATDPPESSNGETFVERFCLLKVMADTAD